MSEQGRRPTRVRLPGPRAQRKVRLLVALGVAVGCAVLASCTSADTPPGDLASGTAVVTLSNPAPSLTPLDVVECAITRTLPSGASLLPAPVVWPSGQTDETGDTFETVSGAAPAQCPGELPTSRCRPDPPWAGPVRDDFFVASGAERLVDGSTATYFAGSVTTGTPVPNRQSVRYDVLDLRAGDPRGALVYLERVMRECADARPQVVGRSTRLVGTTKSYYRQGPATVVLLTGQDAAAWVVIDGTTAIDDAERARIVAIAASRLLPS